MPIKLQVTKEDANEGEPADYLFEQDRITIGRGSNNDLTLPDQKVSTEHAEIRTEGGTYLLVDRGSKNKTYVDGRRVGEAEPYTLESGDVFQVGDFRIEFAPLFMPSSEQTAFAEDQEASNPFENHTRQLAAALEGLAETYKFVPDEDRSESFSEAVDEHLDTALGEEKAVQRILQVLQADDASSASDGAAGGLQGAEASVLDALLESVARMVSIPNHFWREFAGETLDHPPEKEVLFQSDLDGLREHLLGDDVSPHERERRLEQVRDAVDSLVTHNMAMLAGYKKSVMAGTKALLRELDPREAGEGGGMMGGMFGGGDGSDLNEIKKTWKALYRKDSGDLEQEFFRPTYVDTYVDRMSDTWDLDEAEVVTGTDGS